MSHTRGIPPDPPVGTKLPTPAALTRPSRGMRPPTLRGSKTASLTTPSPAHAHPPLLDRLQPRMSPRRLHRGGTGGGVVVVVVRQARASQPYAWGTRAHSHAHSAASRVAPAPNGPGIGNSPACRRRGAPPPVAPGRQGGRTEAPGPRRRQSRRGTPLANVVLVRVVKSAQPATMKVFPVFPAGAVPRVRAANPAHRGRAHAAAPVPLTGFHPNAAHAANRVPTFASIGPSVTLLVQSVRSPVAAAVSASPRLLLAVCACSSPGSIKSPKTVPHPI